MQWPRGEGGRRWPARATSERVKWQLHLSGRTSEAPVALQGRVVAIEPIPDIYAALERNIATCHVANEGESGDLESLSELPGISSFCGTSNLFTVLPLITIFHAILTGILFQKSLQSSKPLVACAGSSSCLIQSINAGVSDGRSSFTSFTFYPRAAGEHPRQSLCFMLSYCTSCPKRP